MRTTLAVFAPLLAALVVPHPAAAAAAKAKGHRSWAFVLPAKGAASEALAGKVEGYVLSELAKDKTYTVVDGGSVVGGGAPPAAKAAFDRAAKAMEDGRKLMKQGRWPDAETKFKTARADYEKVLAWIEPQEWTESLAWLGAATLLRGETEEAKKTLRELAIFDRSYDIGKLRVDRGVVKAFRQAVDEIVSGPRGTLNVYSKPGGARVYVNGTLKGYAPTALDRLPEGRHLVQIDRAGYELHGEMVEVSAGAEAAVKAKLKPTPEGAALDKAVADALAELKKKPGPAALKLGGKLRLDRAVFGVASGETGQGRVELFLVDFRGERVLARRTEVFEGGEFDDAEKAVRGLLKTLLIEGEQAAADDGEGGDPLDKRSGTEEWYEKEERGGKDRGFEDDDDKPRGKPAGDPLDDVSGMEDW